jgi:hypothetical protein
LREEGPERRHADLGATEVEDREHGKPERELGVFGRAAPRGEREGVLVPTSDPLGEGCPGEAEPLGRVTRGETVLAFGPERELDGGDPGEALLLPSGSLSLEAARLPR